MQLLEKRRVSKNENGDSRYRQLLSGVDEMEYFHNIQELLWLFPKKKVGFSLNNYYQNINDEFLKSEDFYPNTKRDIICRKLQDVDWVNSEFPFVNPKPVKHWL